MGDRFGHVKIDGQDYRIDLQTYRARDVTDFAPRATVPGGGIIFSELNLYQPLSQTDWRHGFGFYWHTDASGYAASFSLDTRHAGIAMPFTSPLVIGGAANPIDCSQFLYILDGSEKDLVFNYGTGGVQAVSERCFSATTGAQTISPTGTAVNMMFTNGSYVFLCQQSTRLLRSKISNIISGQATSATGTTLVDTSKTWTDDQWNNYSITILAGTGVGQTRTISDTVGSTKTVTVSVAWGTTPDATSYYLIYKWDNAGVNTASTDYSWMIAHDGFIFAGKRDSNYVYYDSTEDLSDLHGTPASVDPVLGDPNAIPVGVTGRSVMRACSYNGDLYFARIDGLYKMDKDRSAARKILDYSDQLHPYNFQTMIVFNGNLIFPVANQLYQWNGVRVTPITPPRISEVYPFTQYSKFRHLLVYGNYLFAIARKYISTEDSSDDLMAFDGVGWHKLWEFKFSADLLASTYPISACNLIILREGSAATGGTGIWVSHQTIDATPTSRFLYVVSLNMNDEYPYPRFQTNRDAIMTTSRFDAGFRKIVKSTPSILIEASNLDELHTAAPSGKYILVYYRLNKMGTSNLYDSAWIPWGQREGQSNKIQYNGITELKYPLGYVKTPTIEYYWMELKFVFHSIAASCPILEGYTIRLLMRPDTDYGFGFNIYASEAVEYGMGRTESRGVKEILDYLRRARDSKAPIVYEDPFGVEHFSYITSVTELAIEEHVDDVGPSPNIEHVVQINLIDAGLPFPSLQESLPPGGEVMYA